MTPADIRLLAHGVVHDPDEDCLEVVGELLRALADVVEAAKNAQTTRWPPLVEALARVEALPA